MLIRIMRFSGTAVYTPGKYLHVADALSRAPLSLESGSENNACEIEFYIQSIAATWPVRDARLEEIRKKSHEDYAVRTTMEYTMYGWPQYKEDIVLAARPFYDIRNELSVVDGLLVRGDRIVIPYSLRNEVMTSIHDGHLGINKCRERANSGVWWPGMSSDIKSRVGQRHFCVEK